MNVRIEVTEMNATEILKKALNKKEITKGDVERTLQVIIKKT